MHAPRTSVIADGDANQLRYLATELGQWHCQINMATQTVFINECDKRANTKEQTRNETKSLLYVLLLYVYYYYM